MPGGREAEDLCQFRGPHLTLQGDSFLYEGEQKLYFLAMLGAQQRTG